MGLDKRSLQRLRKRLPTEYIKAAQDKLLQRGRDLAKSYISQIISGHRFNQEVIEVLIEVADEYQAQQRSLAARARGAQATA